MAQLQGEHHAIMRAIVDRDTDHAVQLTEDHIRSAAAALPHMTQKPAPPR